MPKSRGRNGRRNRPSKSNRSAKLRGNSAARAKTVMRDQYAPHLQAIIAADECEAAGDPRGALEVMGEFPYAPDGGVLWRSWRINRLFQLCAVTSALPAWAYARWMLHQSAAQLTRSSVERTLRAVDLTNEVRGPSPFGRPRRRSSTVTDRDWITHQLVVHDLGGLADFIATTPAILDLAGDVRSWVGTPMGGYRLADASDDELVWVDLCNGAEISTINLGTARVLSRGRCVIGRVVTCDGVRLFDVAPCGVDEELALAVATNPSGWLDAIKNSEKPWLLGCLASGQDAPLLTDVPDHIWRDELADPYGLEHPGYDEEGREIELSTEELDSLAVDAILRLLRGGAAPIDDPWTDRPSVAAAIISPGVWQELVWAVNSEDATSLAAWGDVMVGPASDMCRQLSQSLRKSA